MVTAEHLVAQECHLPSHRQWLAQTEERADQDHHPLYPYSVPLVLVAPCYSVHRQGVAALQVVAWNARQRRLRLLLPPNQDPDPKRHHWHVAHLLSYQHDQRRQRVLPFAPELHREKLEVV